MDALALRDLYVDQRKSVDAIAKQLRCSTGRVNYWLTKHAIPRRSISEAIYNFHNPKGDPFSTKAPQALEEAMLFGVGLGLYWGEGTKKNMCSIRIGNTDPHLIKAFLLFLRRFYQINRSRLRFGLQIFTDMDIRKEEIFWQEFLGIGPEQFYKTINTRSGSIGTYRKKSEHGVLTLYFHNKKLRDILVGEIERIKHIR